MYKTLQPRISTGAGFCQSSILAFQELRADYNTDENWKCDTETGNRHLAGASMGRRRSEIEILGIRKLQMIMQKIYHFLTFRYLCFIIEFHYVSFWWIFTPKLGDSSGDKAWPEWHDKLAPSSKKSILRNNRGLKMLGVSWRWLADVFSSVLVVHEKRVWAWSAVECELASAAKLRFEGVPGLFEILKGPKAIPKSWWILHPSSQGNVHEHDQPELQTSWARSAGAYPDAAPLVIVEDEGRLSLEAAKINTYSL